MEYNIHPIFVHFPIALLCIYSVIKVLPLQKWLPAIGWKHIERVFLLLGVLGAFASLATGEVAEHLTRPNHDLVEAHSLFAAISTWLYVLLLIGEILTLGMVWMSTNITSARALKTITYIRELLTDKLFSSVLTLLGLVAILVTGLLGGVMVYGMSADPLAPIVLKILGIDF